MIATNEDSLYSLFQEAISEITPRIQYKGSEGWKPYDRAVSGPSRTRRFRLIFEAGNLYPGGAMAGRLIEHECTLRVRTDYAGDHARQQHVIIDDFHQIGDALTNLKSSDNGLMLVTRLRVEEIIGDIEDDDVVQIDHVYSVRYMRSVHL